MRNRRIGWMYAAVFVIGLAVSLGVFTLACGPSDPGSGTDGGSGGDGSVNDGGGSGDGSVLNDGGLPDARICDEVEFDIQALPPNLLILLDRSGSMGSDVPNATGNRWDVAVAAILQVTSQFDGMIRFGLGTFSSCLSGGCSAGAIQIPIADNNANAISSFLGGLAGEGSSDGNQVNGSGKIMYLCDSGDPETTTGPTLQALVGEASLAATDRDNAILLLTDGEESGSCVSGGNTGPVAAGHLHAQSVPVQTYAVGFMGANLTELQNIATAGGTGQPYMADQAADLQNALNTIAGAVATCKYALTGLDPTADTNQVNFYFDGTLVGYDQDCSLGTGWTWTDGTQTEVRFCDTPCGQIQGLQVSEISATFGCQTEPVQ